MFILNSKGQAHHEPYSDTELYENALMYVYGFNAKQAHDSVNYIDGYFTVVDLSSWTAIDMKTPLPRHCILGFTPKSMHPAHTEIVLKANGNYRILDSFLTDDMIDSYREKGILDERTFCISDLLMIQLSQTYEFLKTYQQGLEDELFPAYAEKISRVFIENSRYME